MIEKLKIIEQVLLKSLLVGFALFLFSFIAYLLMGDFVIDHWGSLYGLKEEVTRSMILYMYGLTKILLFVGFFVPLIGVYWTRKSLEKQA